jgi:hypothetical protein
MFLTAMIPFHKSSIKLKKYRKLEGYPTHELEGGAPPFPRFQREGGDVDFLSLFLRSENKKAPRRFPQPPAGTNAGLVSLTMTCLSYLLVMNPNGCPSGRFRPIQTDL